MSRREQPVANPALILLLAAGVTVGACAPADGPAGGGSEDAAPAASGTGAPGEATISSEGFESGDTGIFQPGEPPEGATGPAGEEPGGGSAAASGESHR